jgi:hypothetical protein
MFFLAEPRRVFGPKPRPIAYSPKATANLGHLTLLHAIGVITGRARDVDYTHVALHLSLVE